MCDADGQMLGLLYMHNIPCCLSPLASEALVVLFGLCLNLALIMESDALNVIETMKMKSFNLSEIGVVIEEVKTLASEFDTVQWSAVRTNCNRVAH